MGENLLTNLLTYRPRPGRTSQEDFLTEAFAHLLRSSEEACKVISRLVEADAFGFEGLDVQTQERFDIQGAGRQVFADMTWHVKGETGAPSLTLFEHKWGSDVDDAQLSRYRKVVADAGRPWVVFIGATTKQRRNAKGSVDRALTWGIVHVALEQADLSSDFAVTFIGFLEDQGLTMPNPITREKLKAYALGKSLPGDCKRLAGKLNGKNWDTVLPDRIGNEHRVTDRWGRIGLMFNWDPGLFMGFLMDGSDHQLDLLKPELGPDVMMCLDAGDQYRPQFADSKLFRNKIDELREVGSVRSDVRVEGPYELKNRYRQLVIRVPLATVVADIDGSSAEAVEARQVDALCQLFKDWSDTLFRAGEMEQVFDDVFGSLDGSSS